MSRLLVIITRPTTVINDQEVGNGKLWADSSLQRVGADAIWVIPGHVTSLPGDDSWLEQYNLIQNKPDLATYSEVGVIYHRQEGAFQAPGDIAALKAAFPGIEKHKNYSSTDTEKYRQHQGLATAIQQSQVNATVLFDRFWLTCFKDPILEDLILLLQTHARKKSEGEPIEDLERLKTAVAGNGHGQAQGNGRNISDKAIELVSAGFIGGSGYNGLRKALIDAIVAQEASPNA